MADLTTEYNRIVNAKASLKTAINAKGGSLTNETLDQYASAVNALPTPKEEETKTITPDFSTGNQVVTPTAGKVLSQITLTKPTDLIPENVAKDKNVCGIVGTLESGGGGSPIYEYTLNVTTTYDWNDSPDYLYLTIVFGNKIQKTIIDNKDYYHVNYFVYATYKLDGPNTSPYTANDGFDMYRLFWDRDLFNGNTSFKIKSNYNPEIYECLGIYYASDEIAGYTTLSMNGAVSYANNKTETLPISNGSILKQTYWYIFETFHSGQIVMFKHDASSKQYYPKLSNQTLHVVYDD